MHELSGLKLLTRSRLNFNHFNERTLQHKTTTSNAANYIWPQNRPLKRRICFESNFKKFFRWSPVIVLLQGFEYFTLSANVKILGHTINYLEATERFKLPSYINAIS